MDEAAKAIFQRLIRHVVGASGSKVHYLDWYRDFEGSPDEALDKFNKDAAACLEIHKKYV